MTLILGDGVPEIFEALPRPIQQEAARLLRLLLTQPRMYPVRLRGLMKGYRYFSVDGYLFYYQVSSSQVRLSAVIPGRMRQA